MKKIAIVISTLFIIFIAVMFFRCNKKEAVVTIKYAAWNLDALEKNSIERQMVDSFNKKHPNIKVEIDESFVKNYDDAFKKAADKKALPDVFMYVSNPQAEANGFCSDLTDIVNKDKEWTNIPIALRKAVQIKGKIIAVPMSMYLDGYYYNEDLFKAQKVSLPNSNFSVNNFENILSEVTDVNKGCIGLADESSIIDWYPAEVNKKLGWYSWDGGKFNLNSSEFKAGVNLAKDIYSKKLTYANLSEDEKKKLKGSTDWEAWTKGSVAIKFDGSWNSSDYSKLAFKVGFAGLPGGRSCIVPDFLFISNSSNHPKEAYEFAKFMSAYSLEGFKERMKLSKKANTIVSSLPMINDNKTINDYFSNINIDGLKAEYNKFQSDNYIEGVKILPGYADARWNYVTNIKAGGVGNAKIGDVLTNTFRGSLKIENIADQLNSYANDSIQLFPRQYDN